jgi:hypothetical protein
MADLLCVRDRLEANVPEILKPLTDETWALIDKEAQDNFCSWQFERLLNRTADLLDRANEDRSALLGMLAADFELRLGLASAELKLQQDAERVKLGNNALAEPVAYWALSAKRTDIVAASKDGIHEKFNEQIHWLDRQLISEPALTGERRFGIEADKRNAQAARAQFLANTGNSVREASAEAEELGRIQRELALTTQHHEARMAAAQKGGVLDLGHQAEVVSRRMLRDYQEALARLSAAQKGLSEILGRGIVRPRVGGGSNVLDAIVNSQKYVRDLLLWHDKATQYDQGFTVVVRVRDHCSDASWSDFLRGKSLTFKMDKEAFNAWWLPRLRSVCATYDGKQTRPISLRIKVPEVALRSDGEQIIQSGVPPCALGRVHNASSGREPEANGGVTWVNACPIQADGHAWEVGLQRFGPAAQRWDDALDDVVLELACVGIPIKNAKKWAPETLQLVEA